MEITISILKSQFLFPGHTETVKALLDYTTNPSRFSVERTFSGCTPIHLAACGGHLETVKALVKCSDNPNTPNYIGQSPIDYVLARLGIPTEKRWGQPLFGTGTPPPPYWYNRLVNILLYPEKREKKCVGNQCTTPAPPKFPWLGSSDSGDTENEREPFGKKIKKGDNDDDDIQKCPQCDHIANSCARLLYHYRKKHYTED